MLPPGPRRKRNWSTPPRAQLPEGVSQWRRQHAGKHLHIFYAKRYFETPKDLKEKITGSIREFTKEQEDYIDFVSKHLTFNLSLHQFYQLSAKAEKAIMECATYVEKLKAEQK